MRRTLSGALVILVLGALAIGQQPAAPAKSATPATSDSISGKELYTSYCAMCHGNDAKGGGPFSPQLKTWPPDLTQLARKNHGIYPAMRVSEMIDGEFGKASTHGSREMPIWGPVFRSMAKRASGTASVPDSICRR